MALVFEAEKELVLALLARGQVVQRLEAAVV